MFGKLIEKSIDRFYAQSTHLRDKKKGAYHNERRPAEELPDEKVTLRSFKVSNREDDLLKTP